MESDVTTPSTEARPSLDSVELVLEQVGDRWTFLVLREAFFRVRHFDEMQRNTGMSAAKLTERLRRLVDTRILAALACPTHPHGFEYLLTDKGLDLYPAIVMLLGWGDRWLTEGDPPIVLTHTACGHDLRPELCCEHCGDPIRATDVEWRPGV